MRRFLTLGLMATTMLGAVAPAVAAPSELRGGRGGGGGQSGGVRPAQQNGNIERQGTTSAPPRQQSAPPPQNTAPPPPRMSPPPQRTGSAVTPAPVPPSRPAQADARPPRGNVLRPGSAAVTNWPNERRVNGDPRRNDGRTGSAAQQNPSVPAEQRANNNDPRRNWNGSRSGNGQRPDNQRPDNARPDNAQGDSRWTDNDRNRDRNNNGRDDGRNGRGDDRNGNRNWNGNDRDNNGQWRNGNDNRNGARVWNGQRRLNDRDRWANVRRWDNNSWRHDRRYDWQNYRTQHRYIYRLPTYYAPYGWYGGYSRFSIGFFMNSLLFAPDYWIDDPYNYRLPPAYGTLRWVRYYDDALLIDIRDGYVVDVIHGFFW